MLECEGIRGCTHGIPDAKLNLTYLDNNPFRRRRGIYEGVEECTKLVNDFVWYGEQRQRAPNNPFRIWRKRIQLYLRIANKCRMSCRLFIEVNSAQVLWVEMA